MAERSTHVEFPRTHPDWYNVAEFGLAGDGVTDDTAALH